MFLSNLSYQFHNRCQIQISKLEKISLLRTSFAANFYLEISNLFEFSFSLQLFTSNLSFFRFEFLQIFFCQTSLFEYNYGFSKFCIMGQALSFCLPCLQNSSNEQEELDYIELNNIWSKKSTNWNMTLKLLKIASLVTPFQRQPLFVNWF